MLQALQYSEICIWHWEGYGAAKIATSQDGCKWNMQCDVRKPRTSLINLVGRRTFRKQNDLQTAALH
jgi:hypothetical protein